MRTRALPSLFLSSLILGFLASGAYALDVADPSGTDRVSSQPVFVFDEPVESGDFEFSKTNDMQQGGDRDGWFVSPTFSPTFWQLDGVSKIQLRSDRLYAGWWYWRARLTTPDNRTALTPVRRVEVEDDAPLFTGWIASAQRMRRVPHCSPVVVRIRVDAEDNAPDNVAMIGRVTVRVGGKARIKTRMAVSQVFVNRYSVVVCTKARKVTVVVRVEDRIGQSSRTRVKTLTVRPRTT